MKWTNLIKVAMKSIMKNRMRSALTILGIVIGVGAVIALVSVGQGASADIQKEISSMGTNIIMIMPGSSRQGGVNRGAGSYYSLTMTDVQALQDEGNLIRYVSPVVSASGQVIANNRNWSTRTQGVAANYLTIKDWALSNGSFFSEKDVHARKKVAVLGQTVVEELFADVDPIGQKIRIGNIPFTVIGVLEEKGQSGMGDQDDIILAPFETVLYRMSDGKSINMIIWALT